MASTAAEIFSTGNEYHTPPSTAVPLAYKIPAFKSFWFHTSFICGLLRRSHKLAINHKFDHIAFQDAGYAYLKHIERAGGKFHITGLRNLDVVSGPMVIVANHMSLCETFVLAAMIGPRKGENSFVIKESLTRYPLFGPVVTKTKPITVTRKKPREDLRRVMEQGVEAIKQGRCVTIFPQNRRRVSFRASEFNTIGEKLAAKAGVPVLPVALRTDFLAPGKIILDLSRIRPERPLNFEFAPPIPPEIDKKTKHQKIIKFISSRMEQWGIPCLD